MRIYGQCEVQEYDLTLCELPATVCLPSGIDYCSYKPHVVVFLYGGSKDFSRKRLSKFAGLFSSCGFTCITFDYRGMFPNSLPHCKTGLHTRIYDAHKILQSIRTVVKNMSSLSIYAISMGGHIAARVAAYSAAHNLIMHAPAAYSSLLEEKKIPFGEKFTQILRSEGSWKTSAAFKSISHFTGNLLIFRFAKDERVEPAVLNKYYESAANASRTLLELPYAHATFNGDNTAKQSALAESAIRWLLDNAKNAKIQ